MGHLYGRGSSPGVEGCEGGVAVRSTVVELCVAGEVEAEVALSTIAVAWPEKGLPSMMYLSQRAVTVPPTDKVNDSAEKEAQ
jgi:hypothetical protein